MAAKHAPGAVNSFVNTARGLIVVQLLVTAVALISGLWAVFAIRQATDARALAEASEQAANAAELAAEQRIKDSQDFAAMLSEFTRAADRNDLQRAIEGLSARIAQAGGADVRTYALLASAQYRVGAVLEAASAAEEAVRRNDAELSAISEALGADTLLNEQLYLDLAAYRCAAGAPDAEVASAVAAAPAPVREVLAASNAASISEHALLRRSDVRWPACAQAVRAELQQEPSTASSDNLFAIRFIFFQAPPDFDPQLKHALIAALPASYQAPGVETIARDYQPGVRYYYAEQRDEAEQIAALLRAQASGPQWSEANFGVSQLTGDGLPRDRAEVWLPRADLADLRVITSLEVQYYRHVADGLVIEEVLNRRIGAAQRHLRAPTLLNADQANMLACHPQLSGSALDDFKELAIALIEAGAPIGRIWAFRAPGTKPANRIEIVASDPAPRGTLSIAQVRTLTSCPVQLNANERRVREVVAPD